MRLAIFGGTFDPPHIGHYLAALDAAEQLPADRVLFVPAAVQPLKVGRSEATAAQRVEMVRRMVRGDARFEVSTVEADRPGLSFTVDTLTHFAAAFPGDDRFLLLGEDVLATFAQWREPERILSLAQLVLLTRPGTTEDAVPGMLARADLVRVATRRIDISSSEIRERVRRGQSIRGFVTDEVAAYIDQQGLYRQPRSC